MAMRIFGIGLLAAFVVALVVIVGTLTAQDSGNDPTGTLPLPGWVKAEMWTPHEVIVSWAPVAGAESYDVTLYFGEDTPALAWSGVAVYGSSHRTGANTVNTHWRYSVGPWETANLVGACVYASASGYPRPTGPEGCVWAEVNRRPATPAPTPFLPPAPERVIAIVLHDPGMLVVTWRPVPGVDSYGVKAFFHGHPFFSVMTAGTVYAVSNVEEPEVDFQNLKRVCVFARGHRNAISECEPAEIVWEVKPQPTPRPASPPPQASPTVPPVPPWPLSTPPPESPTLPPPPYVPPSRPTATPTPFESGR